ncbi:MAG: CAP domain-containing protein [Opitutae bacterium]|nr:CAP domain-containing protein [Opitutae bacterium]
MKLGRAILALGALTAAGWLPARDLMAMRETEFAGQPGLNAQLEAAHLDRGLLAAAIFHETNRVRSQFNLPPLKFLAKLNDAADLQAEIGGAVRPPSHTNPFMLVATPLDRVKYAGLNPRYVAENIALTAMLKVSSGHGVGLLSKDGQASFVDVATLEPLKPHNYTSYAAFVVQAWMDSPGHRANILNPEVSYLGCSVRPTRGDHGLDMVFCVQVFYTPTRTSNFRSTSQGRQWRSSEEFRHAFR